MDGDQQLQLWENAVNLLRVWRDRQPAIGWFRPSQQTLFTYDPCKALSERTCWACPLEHCRRQSPE